MRFPPVMIRKIGIAAAAASTIGYAAPLPGAGTSAPAPAIGPNAVQPDPAGGAIRMSLDDALRIALDQSPSTQAVADRIQRARAHVHEVGAAVQPQVNGVGTYTRTGPISTFTLPGAPGKPAQTIRLGAPSSKTFAFTARKDLDLAGQNRISRDIARKGITSAELDLATAQNNLLLSVYNSYYGVLRADELVTVQQEAVADAEEQRRVAEAQYRAGASAQFDVIRAAVQVENLRQQLTTARKSASLARATLLNAIGADVDTPIDVVPVRLPPAPGSPEVPGTTSGAPSATPPGSGTGSVAPDPMAAEPAPAEASAHEVPLDLTGALAAAYDNRPEVQNAATQVRIAERSVDLARRGLRPDVSLNGQYLFTPDVSGFSAQKKTWSLNAQLNIPIFDGGLTRARVAESRSDVDSARESLIQVQQAVGLDVRSSLLDLQEAAQRRETAAANVVQAHEALRIAQVRFKAGVSTTVEVTDAQVALTQAESNQVSADFDYLSAEAHLRKSVGMLVPAATERDVRARPGPPPTPMQVLQKRRGERPVPPTALSPSLSTGDARSKSAAPDPGPVPSLPQESPH